MFGFFVLFLNSTIGEFSEELGEQLFFPTLFIAIFLIIFGIILAFIDKEFIHIVTDERTKKIDRSAVYFSWWISILFMVLFGIIASGNNFTVMQYSFASLSVMILSMLILHMFFNFKGNF
jgi:uncharacterized membrane protein